MTLVALLEGPEGAGKTTLARRLAAELSGSSSLISADCSLGEFPCSEVELWDRAVYRHWRGYIPTVWTYLAAAKHDAASLYPVVWDRAWPSEHVYSNLLDREDKGIKNDPWLGEWCFGRAFQAAGSRIAVLGPSILALEERRAARTNSDDLPVSPADERRRYLNYGRAFGYLQATDDRSLDAAVATTLHRYQDYLRAGLECNPRPPHWCGPLDASVVILGEARSFADDRSWLPFTSAYTERLGRALGATALHCGWTNVEDAPLPLVRRARLVVACGAAAAAWALKNAAPASVYSIPHPAALYRWGEFRDRIPEVEGNLCRVVEALI